MSRIYSVEVFLNEHEDETRLREFVAERLSQIESNIDSDSCSTTTTYLPPKSRGADGNVVVAFLVTIAGGVSINVITELFVKPLIATFQAQVDRKDEPSQGDDT